MYTMESFSRGIFKLDACMEYIYVLSAFVLFLWMKRTMETSGDLLCQRYYDASNQWNEKWREAENEMFFIKYISALMSNDWIM